MVRGWGANWTNSDKWVGKKGLVMMKSPWVLRGMTTLVRVDGQTDRQIDVQTDRLTDRQILLQMDGKL